MAGSVRDIDRGFAELERTLAELAGADVAVLVGVSGQTDRDMVVIAASNEFGTADGHVPERSFLRDTVDNRTEEILDDLEGAVEAALDGANLDTALGRVGEKWAGEVKTAIRDKADPPNAAATIAAKGADNPLIDQGRLRNAITWRLSKAEVTEPVGGA